MEQDKMEEVGCDEQKGLTKTNGEPARYLLFMAGGETKGLREEALASIKTFEDAGFHVTHATCLDQALPALTPGHTIPSTFHVVVTKLGVRQEDAAWPLVKAARAADKRTFVAVYSWTAANSASTRLKLFEEGANMVTASISDLASVLSSIALQGTRAKSDDRVYECPSCGMDGLTAHELWVHHPMYHVGDPNTPMICPICSGKKKKKLKYHDRFPVHLFNEHAPPGMHTENYPPTTIYAFALVVCQRPSDKRFLLVQEFANSGFWLPGGRVDPGEELTTAAIREVKEEAGIDVELTGILRWEWAPKKASRSDDSSYVRMRVIFYGRPRIEEQLPKSIPDYESAGAVWASADEVMPHRGLRLRGREPQEWFSYVDRGGAIYPLSLLTGEGAPSRS